METNLRLQVKELVHYLEQLVPVDQNLKPEAKEKIAQVYELLLSRIGKRLNRKAVPFLYQFLGKYVPEAEEGSEHTPMHIASPGSDTSTSEPATPSYSSPSSHRGERQSRHSYVERSPSSTPERGSSPVYERFQQQRHIPQRQHSKQAHSDSTATTSPPRPQKDAQQYAVDSPMEEAHVGESSPNGIHEPNVEKNEHPQNEHTQMEQPMQP